MAATRAAGGFVAATRQEHCRQEKAETPNSNSERIRGKVQIRGPDVGWARLHECQMDGIRLKKFERGVKDGRQLQVSLTTQLLVKL